MTAGLQRGLALAGIGVAVGLAVVAALFGTGDLLKRVRGAVTPGETPRTAADVPKTGTAGSGDKPSADTQKSRPDTGDQAAVDPGKALPPGPDAAPQEDSRQAEAARTPSLDILRVEPSGDTVLAGRGAPKASVELMRDNRTVGRATADESGQFAMDSLTLPPGNSELTLRSTTPDGRTTEGKASAVVVVDKDRKAQPLVAVSEPDKPTRVLSMPSPSAPQTADAAKDSRKDIGKEPGKSADAADGGAAPPPRREAALPQAGGRPERPTGQAAPVKIVSVDAQEGGRLFVSGQGAAWTSLRLYLNDTLVASGRSGADGRIAFTIGRGVKPGGYQIRIDQVDDTSGKVGHRAQVGFTFPTQLAAREPAKEPTRTAAKDMPAAKDLPAVKDLPAAAAKPEAQAARSPERPATPPSAPKPSAAETPAMAAGAARPGAPTPEADRRAAEALSPTLPGAGKLPGAEAGTGTPPAAASGTVQGLPTNPPGAPPRLTEGLSKAQPDMAASAAPTPAGQTATVFVPEIDTAKITRGDNLWQISRRSYGDGKRYTVIYDANRDQIRDPNLIYPGQIFVMPKDDAPTAAGQPAKRG